MDRILSFFIISIFFTTSLIANIILTKGEKEFINKHKQIVLGTSKSWKPYVILNKDGTVTGYDNEVLNLINKVSGANFVLKAAIWKDMVKEAQNNTIDGLSTCVSHPERKKYLKFSNIYISMQKMVITSKTNSKQIKTLDDIKGKKIAIHKSNLVEEKTALKFKDSIIQKYDSVEDVIQSVATGDSDVMFGNGATLYLANELGFGHLKLAVALDGKLELAFGVRKDWPEAVSILNKSLEYIGEQKLLELKKKWFLLDIDKNRKNLVFFTKEERDYLNNKKKIKMCIDPDWMPFEKIKNNKHIGMSADYFNLLKNKLPIDIELVATKTWSESLEYAKRRECDILSLAMETKKRKEYLKFTTPYLTVPLVIATKPNIEFIDNFRSLKDKKVGIPRGYSFIEILEERFPNLIIVEVDNIKDGLQKVSDGELFGYIGTLASVGYQFQQKFTGELKIAGKFDDKWALGVAIRNDDPLLFNIFQKVIDSISDNEHKAILNKWIAVKYEKGKNYKLIWEVLFISLFILSLIFFWNLMLKKEITKRKKVEAELTNLNESLNDKIKDAVFDVEEKNRKLEESIKNFEYLLDATMETIVFIDLDTKKILDVNRAGLLMFGITDKKEVIGRHIFEFIVESELHKIAESMKYEESNPYELTLSKKDGSLIYTINKAKTIERNGKKIRMSTLIDITEIKQKEKLLQQQSRLAQMGEMISMIAHQWRQPLGAISSAVFSVQTKISSNRYDLNEYTQRDQFIEFINKKHNNINEYVQFLSTTIDDFRNFFKPDKEKENISLTTPIVRALQIVQISMESKGITIVKEFEIDPVIKLYQNEMMQVVLNILKNCEDNFLEKDSLNPHVVINTQEKSDRYLIVISDNGGGIKKNIIEKIFDPYFSTKDEKNGTGLGLYMSKTIVEDHNGGLLEVKNIDGGVSFEISLFKE